MGRRELVGGGEDVLGHRVEDGRVITEHLNVEDLLRVVDAQPQPLQFRVEPGLFGAEIGDAERRRDAGPRQHHDVARLLEQVHDVVDGVVRHDLGSLGQLPGHGQGEQAEVGLVRTALKKVRRTDAKGRQHLLGRDRARVYVHVAELVGADSAQLLAEGD